MQIMYSAHMMQKMTWLCFYYVCIIMVMSSCAHYTCLFPGCCDCLMSDQKHPTMPPKQIATRNVTSVEKRGQTCVSCKQRPRTIMFLPCSHQITCSSCADVMENCASCGRTILGTYKVSWPNRARDEAPNENKGWTDSTTMKVFIRTSVRHAMYASMSQTDMWGSKHKNVQTYTYLL